MFSFGLSVNNLFDHTGQLEWPFPVDHLHCIRFLSCHNFATIAYRYLLECFLL